MTCLILVGLISVAFVSALKFEPVLSLTGFSVQQTKEFLSLMLCMLTILWALYYKGNMRKFRNVPFLAFLFFLILSPIYFPPFVVVIDGMDEGGFWVYPPILQSLIYALAFICISCVQMKRSQIITILKTISWCGFIMGCLILLQATKIKPFYAFINHEYLQAATKPFLVGTIGNSTWTAAYLILTIPATLYLKSWWRSLVIIVAVLMCRSMMATGAMVFGLMLYGSRFINIPYRVSVSTICCTILVLGCMYWTSTGVMKNEMLGRGRLHVWKEAVKIVTGPVNILEISDKMSKEQKDAYKRFNDKKYAMFGYGMGSYEYLISKKIKTIFKRLHNEYLEITCNLGIIGSSLFLLSIGYIFYQLARDNTLMGWMFAVTLFMACVNALGTATWQVEPSRFYSLIAAGLACNYVTRGNDVKCCQS